MVWIKSKIQTKKDFHKISFHSVDACRIFNEFALERVKYLHRGLQHKFLQGLFDSDGGIIGKNLTKESMLSVGSISQTITEN